MRGLSESGRFRHGDIVLELPIVGDSASVEVRVWQNVAAALSLYVSARPLEGSWQTLGTIPLDMSGLSESGRYRYGDISVRVLEQ